MTSEYHLSKWSVRFAPDAQPEVVERETGRVIATVHGSDDDVFGRAMLLARAPSLFDAVTACRDVFTMMARYGSASEKEVAAEMLPVLEASLLNLEAP
jgi:hypothetical protein